MREHCVIVIYMVVFITTMRGSENEFQGDKMRQTKKEELDNALLDCDFQAMITMLVSFCSSCQ